MVVWYGATIELRLFVLEEIVMEHLVGMGIHWKEDKKPTTK
jgi:hypothetical protein